MERQEKKVDLLEVVKMLSRKELANILKVSTRTIDRYRDQGMPYYRCNWRGLIGFELEEVKAWLRGE